MSLFHSVTPQSAYRQIMVEKLANAAAQSSAENVILREELKRLRERGQTDMTKVKSRKVLSKALVVTVDCVLKLRAQQEEKDRAANEKKVRAALKKKEKEEQEENKPRIQKKKNPAKQASQRTPIVHFEEGDGFSTDEGAASEGGQEFEVSPAYIDRTTSRRSLEVPSIESSISTRSGRKLRAHK
ncbi:uncharacterized protein LAJ45_01638 [Morchella importuna]|uniref:uncharacterized protein n=1 Tax=Morchella importuna TaxID=1174673 RepID=UPI001E8CDEAF|nr:uncharacterized protein LAJ45_10729 [Morchella importuna]XP_045975175.1 uncharacterized protein LAJ45_01638 [Morchella importuna]KAH8145292.1 hypothetical protein LAJ45_10729 [Morchella importuna]KAH8153871.1 hypothetical protein LAJ45_01638 [Morchella importuna]